VTSNCIRRIFYVLEGECSRATTCIAHQIRLDFLIMHLYTDTDQWIYFCMLCW